MGGGGVYDTKSTQPAHHSVCKTLLFFEQKVIYVFSLYRERPFTPTTVPLVICQEYNKTASCSNHKRRRLLGVESTPQALIVVAVSTTVFNIIVAHAIAAKTKYPVRGALELHQQSCLVRPLFSTLVFRGGWLCMIGPVTRCAEGARGSPGAVHYNVGARCGGTRTTIILSILYLSRCTFCTQQKKNMSTPAYIYTRIALYA